MKSGDWMFLSGCCVIFTVACLVLSIRPGRSLAMLPLAAGVLSGAAAVGSGIMALVAS